jgi:hypothetical protein
MEPEVPRTPPTCQEIGVDALAIIPDPQPNLLLVIADLDFNLLRPCVPECIAQRLTCDPVDLVTHEWV